MNDPIQYIKTSAEEVRLSSDAYIRVREKLVAHMKAVPVALPSPYARFLRMRVPATATALALILTAGSATAYAAKGSLPGDPLYPVKVKVLEPARGIFAVTPELKASWKADIASERLSEVAELAAREKLTPEESAKGDERFNASLKAAKDSIKSLSKQDPDAAEKIQSSLVHALDEHQSALTSIGAAATSTNANEARSFVGHVRNEIDSTFNENEDVNGSNDQSHSDSKGKSKDEQKGDPRGRAIDIGGGSGDN